MNKLDSHAQLIEAPSVGQIGRLPDEAQSENKSRLAFLLFLVGIERQIQDDTDRYTAELIALLAVMDDLALRRSKRLIEVRLDTLARRIDALVAENRIHAARFGLASATEVLFGTTIPLPAPHHADEAATKLLLEGSRGIPFGDAITALATAYALSIYGSIVRSVTAQKPFREIAADVRARLTGKRTVRGRELTERGSFVSKAAIEARTDLNATYTASLESYAETEQAIDLVWTTSPAYEDSNCRHGPPNCGYYEGMTRAQAKREGGTIPLGSNCLCHWETRIR